MSNSSIVTLTDASFEEAVTNSKLPVLIDFWAEWCGPCKMIAPILDQIAEEYSGKLTVFKINVDENRAIPAKYSVRGIPTLILFKNGKAEATKVGALTKSQLETFLKDHLA